MGLAAIAQHPAVLYRRACHRNLLCATRRALLARTPDTKTCWLRIHLSKTFKPGCRSASLMYPIAPGVEFTKLMMSLLLAISRGDAPLPM